MDTVLNIYGVLLCVSDSVITSSYKFKYTKRSITYNHD